MGTFEEKRQLNRRRSQRRTPRKTVKVECRKGSLGLGPNLAFGVLDVSDSGACLIVTQVLDLKAEVEIIINGYGIKEFIKRLGYVRWQLKLETGHFCIGVEFQKHLDYRDWQNLIAPN